MCECVCCCCCCCLIADAWVKFSFQYCDDVCVFGVFVTYVAVPMYHYQSVFCLFFVFLTLQCKTSFLQNLQLLGQ